MWRINGTETKRNGQALKVWLQENNCLNPFSLADNCKLDIILQPCRNKTAKLKV